MPKIKVESEPGLKVEKLLTMTGDNRRKRAHAGLAKPKEAPSMAIEQRLRELDARHRDLDLIIENEAKRPSVDATRLSAMKRQKLKLKEEIEEIRQKLEHH
jgi:hypothetical protein